MEKTSKATLLQMMNSMAMRPPLHAVYRVEDIYLIFTGFVIGLSLGRSDRDEVWELFEGFQTFTKNYLGVTDGGVGWSHAIRLNSDSDRNSLSIFFTLFYKYLVAEKQVTQEEADEIAKWRSDHNL